MRWKELLLEGKGGPMLVVMTLHHAAGISMVIPMNLYYGDNAYYHELVMLLQFAAFGAIMLQEYGFTLDIQKPDGLRKMKVAVYLSFALMYYSRLLRYLPVGYYILQMLYAAGEKKMFYVGAVVFSMMGIFNLALLSDVTAKLGKFAKMPSPDSKKKP